MNIIFGDSINQVPDHYIKLELDTVRTSKKTFTAYCLVETVPLAEFPMVENNKKNHAVLIEQYRRRNWKYCEQVIESLMGCWNGEVDTFYKEMLARIEEYQTNPPPPDWDGTLLG